MDEVTILLCTYNAEKFIVEQLDSLKKQTYKNIRIIIYDDLSSDNTVRIIKDYIKRNEGLISITLHVNDTRSGGAANNFKQITSDNNKKKYVCYCDQDDIWAENKVERLMSKMLELEEKKLQPYIVCHNCAVTDEQGNVIAHGNIRDMTFYNLIYTPQVQGCCMMMNSLALKALNIGDAYISMHDWYACLVVSAIGHIEVLEDELVYYRQHANNQIGYNRESFLDRTKLLFDIKDKSRRYGEILDQLYSVSRFVETPFLEAFSMYYSQKRMWKTLHLLYKYRALKGNLHGIYQGLMTLIAFKMKG